MKNVDIEKINDFFEKARQNPDLLKREMKVEVAWNMDENNSQMFSTITYPIGKQIFYIDQVDFLGGKGRAPNPIQYCLLGLASCFLATFSTVCKEMNLNINSVKIIAKNKLNLSLPLGISEEKVSEGVDFEIIVDSPESNEKIEEVKRIALSKCPAVWCMKNQIPVNATVQHTNLSETNLL